MACPSMLIPSFHLCVQLGITLEGLPCVAVLFSFKGFTGIHSLPGGNNLY